MLYLWLFLKPIYKYIGYLFYCYLCHNVFIFINIDFWIQHCTLSRIYLACSRAASCFSCLVGVIPSYLYNSLAASLIIIFIVLQFARYSNCGCTPLFVFLIIQFCNNIVISYISLVLRIYIASKFGISFLLSIMLRFNYCCCYCFVSVFLHSQSLVWIGTSNLIILMFRS